MSKDRTKIIILNGTLRIPEKKEKKRSGKY